MTKETTIYIQKAITTDVLEGLKEGDHFVIKDMAGINVKTTEWFNGKNFHSNRVTHVLREITVTTDMVEKEAEDYIKTNTLLGFAPAQTLYKQGWKAAFNWILNYK